MQKNINIVVGLVLIIILIVIFSSSKGQQTESLDQKIINSGEIRIGYIVYPPLLYKDGSTGKLSGVSYEIVEEAAKKLNLKTNWVEEVGWGSAIEGLKTNRYDILGTQMWPNSARAREAVFSLAPMNSVIYPYVKTGDYRFTKNLEKLNSPEFTISALEGEMAMFIANQDYPKAKLNALPQLSSTAEVFLNILNNKADVAFAEPSTVNDFLKSNPGKIERALDIPVRILGLKFAFKRGEEPMVSMWNVALTELISDGAINKILEKYEVKNDYILNK